LRVSHGDVVVESTDGRTWTDAHGRRFASLREAVGARSVFDVVNRRGLRYRVPELSRAALLADADALDRRDFSAHGLGLAPTAAQRGIEDLARDAVSKLLR
jgi:hypothetical protein